jgi:hypothetical protein
MSSEERDMTGSDPNALSVRYHEHHVVGILDTPEAGEVAVNELTASGFLESEVALTSGVERADSLHASSGRGGLIGRVLQVIDRVGAGGEELEARHEYEQALRNGGVNVLVLAPTEERKKLAARILQQHGAHFINFFGPLTIERLD